MTHLPWAMSLLLLAIPPILRFLKDEVHIYYGLELNVVPSCHLKEDFKWTEVTTQSMKHAVVLLERGNINLSFLIQLPIYGKRVVWHIENYTELS